MSLVRVHKRVVLSVGCVFGQRYERTIGSNLFRSLIVFAKTATFGKVIIKA